MAKRRPPTGAPKAEAIPAAAPALMKLRRSCEFLNLSKRGRLNLSVLDWNWLTPAPMRAPMWIMGPSGPTGMPAATEKAHEKNLTPSVYTLKMCRIRVPFRNPGRRYQ